MLVILNILSKSANYWTCQLYYYAFSWLKLTKSQIDHFYEKIRLWLIGFALVYCVGVNERENQISGEKMFQSNIYYYASIKGVLCISGKDVPRRTKKSWNFCQTNQDSCACTRFLCMHNTLVHAQHSCACTGGARAQGQDPKRALAQAGPQIPNFSWYVLVRLFHLCIIHLLCLHNNKYCSETIFPQRSYFLVHLHLHSRQRRIQWVIVNFSREHASTLTFCRL